MRDEGNITYVMMNPSKKVHNSQTQLAIVLPFAHFSNSHGKIRMFTLVIRRQKDKAYIEYGNLSLVDEYDYFRIV